MIPNLETVHKGIFFLLFFLLFIATVVFIERLLYLFFTFPAEKRLLRKEVEENSPSSAEALYYSYLEKLERGKGLLMFVITASPLTGLLGTVLGIMDSFSKMAQRGVSDIAEVSKGIAFALEATALGIAVALIALAYYYGINGLIKKKKGELRRVILNALSEKEEA